MHRDESNAAGLSKYRTTSSSSNLSYGASQQQKRSISFGGSQEEGPIAGIPLASLTSRGKNRSSVTSTGASLYSPSNGSSARAGGILSAASVATTTSAPTATSSQKYNSEMKEGPSYDPGQPSTDSFARDPALMTKICTYLPQRATIRSANVNKKWRKSIFHNFNPTDAVQSEKTYNEFCEKLSEDTQGVGIGKFFFVFYNIGLLIILGTSFASATSSAISDDSTTLALGVSFFGWGIIMLMGVLIFCAAGNKGCKNVFREILMQLGVSLFICLMILPISYMWEVHNVVGGPEIDLNSNTSCNGVGSLEAVFVVTVNPSTAVSFSSWTAGEVSQYSGSRQLSPEGCRFDLTSTLSSASSNRSSLSSTTTTSERFVVAPALWWLSKSTLEDETVVYKAHYEQYPDVPLIGDESKAPSASPGGLIFGLVVLYLLCLALMVLVGVYYVRVSGTRSMMKERVEVLLQEFTTQKARRDEWHKTMKHGEVFDDVKAQETKERMKTLKPGESVAAASAW